MANGDDLKALRANPRRQLLLVSFRATWCVLCIAEFGDLEDTYRMYRVRDLGLVTVSTNMPDERNSVMKLLDKIHATSRNLLFSLNDKRVAAGGIWPAVGASRALHRTAGSRR
jgi:peroxiredoxin